ncbi:MAG: serine/threonine-protein phosphatase [Ruminococcus sp.]|nr:serine/threonine-protein phosphatase [Ruminococcus sp.]
MKFYASSQIGIGKTENEDRMILGRSVIAGGSFITDIKSGIIAVADGVGGNNAGATASHFVAARLSNADTIDMEMLSQINTDLITLSQSSPQYSSMATTLSGIQFADGRTPVFHIGNTRVYALQGGKYLKQLTADDTTLNYLITSGQLSPEEAESFDKKNEIIACFGGGTPALFKAKLSIEDIASPIMLTSDGIHDYLSADDLEDVIDEYGISLQACEKLIELARSNGSMDDASVILGGVD